ncbi:MAG: phenylalanine--tRNA ligase subunit beta [Opitutales bacterium TMED158]|nr:MAG: phenylalanine--tRNA ligase subunit beta [Opitutales bacterium TMED158]
MKISLNWLKRYIDLPESPKEIADSLTLLGFEVDDIHTTGVPELENVLVGEILEREQHPNADKLGVCRVALGDAVGEKSIVCGASNYKVGDRVPVALPGAKLPGGFKIKRSKLRGVESDGMMCSGKEIGAGEDAAGLLILDGQPELGTPINAVLTDSDTVYNLEVTPNRPDCLSHLGIARELAAWYQRELKYPSVDDIAKPESRPDGSDVFKGVNVECEEDCPLYRATIIKGVKIGPSPAWMQELLSSVGLRPINNVVDVTNFVLHEYGNPMHAFDARDIAGGEIIVRNAGEGEKMVTLDGEERPLASRMAVIADSEKALAVAGVMGGRNSEVKDDTTDLVLEVACFNPTTIRRVSKQLGLSTDSSYRFERGVDLKSIRYATDRAIQLILETAGGEVCGPEFSVGSEDLEARAIAFSPNWIRAKSGFDISDEQIRESLELLNMKVEPSSSDEWKASIPSYRGDLERPIDLLEEVLRIYGTDKIPSGVVRSTATGEKDSPITEFVRESSGYLVGQHFSEVVNYTLRSEEEQTAWSNAVSEMPLELKNPISEDQTQLRHSLIPGMLESLRLNQSRKTGATRFFETGRVFRESNGKIVEMISVAFVECSEGASRSWKASDSDDFYTAKRRVENVAEFAGMDISRFRMKSIEGDDTSWQSGHAALIDDSRAGISAEMGLMNLERIKDLDIQGEIVAGSFCILPERLKTAKRIKFQPFSLFPPSSKDLALVVDQSTMASEVVKNVGKIATKATQGAFALEDVDVFDVYEGLGVPEGKKSIAISMSFRSLERTLKDKEVNKAFEAIQSEIKAKTDYEIRD